VRPRVIPVLLLDRARRLVKTRRFADEVYVGDPFNVIRIFNEKEVDEICLLDIHATVDGRSPDVDFIRAVAAECFMPLTYGGGVRTVADCEALVSAGVEKVLIGGAAPAGGLIDRVAKELGTQAVAVSVDVTQRHNRWEVRTHRGRRHVTDEAIGYARRLVDEGAGEILLHNIDRDGCREGYDLSLVSTMARAVSASTPPPSHEQAVTFPPRSAGRLIATFVHSLRGQLLPSAQAHIWRPEAKRQSRRPSPAPSARRGDFPLEKHRPPCLIFGVAAGKIRATLLRGYPLRRKEGERRD